MDRLVNDIFKASEPEQEWQACTEYVKIIAEIK